MEVNKSRKIKVQWPADFVKRTLLELMAVSRYMSVDGCSPKHSTAPPHEAPANLQKSAPCLELKQLLCNARLSLSLRLRGSGLLLLLPLLAPQPQPILVSASN